MQCPADAFVYNTSQCACNPGYLYNATSRSCQVFSVPESVVFGTGVDYSLAFLPTKLFAFNTIKKFTQSQAVFLEATLFSVLSWLLLCLFLRIVGPLRDGTSPWFKVRWWISRLDVCYSTSHWLDDQKPVVKRKTELGGTFSIASWILFVGLFAALLYQIISKRSIEVHTIRAVNGPELESFRNDLDFNITTISSMTCSNLRGLESLVIGNPGSVDYRSSPLSTFANYSCLNTSMGPTVTLKCTNCSLIRDIAYISWQFIDLPNSPATAVGFQFNLTAKKPGDKKHLSYVGGTVKNVVHHDGKPITFRGPETNILKFNLFPRHYHTKHDLRLIQPLLDEFLPGTFFSETRQLQTSLQNSNAGLVNVTLYAKFLTDYIVEVNNQNVIGPVSFFANLGGLYCFSIGIFFYFLMQCEHRIKKFRHEDSVMRRIRSRRKAQERWDKLRKYVLYTWGCSSLADDQEIIENEACCTGISAKSMHKNRSSAKQKRQTELATISFNRRARLFSEQNSIPKSSHSELSMQSSFAPASNLEERSSSSRNEPGDVVDNVKHEGQKRPGGLSPSTCSQTKAFTTDDTFTIPPPPPLGSKAIDEMSLTDLQKGLQNLYDYNVLLSEKLVSAQSVINALSKKSSTSPTGPT